MMIELPISTLGLVILLVITSCIVVYFIGRLHGNKRVNPGDLPPNLLALYAEIQNLPSKVLNTIQGSINPQKGKVAELLTYAELRYDYDVIIPLGKPIDFIGIKNGVGIDFIEVKSTLSNRGGNLNLTEEEKAIQALIKKGLVNFRLVVVRDEVFREPS